MTARPRLPFLPIILPPHSRIARAAWKSFPALPVMSVWPLAPRVPAATSICSILETRRVDVIKDLTELRDVIRKSVDYFEMVELSPEQSALLAERKDLLREIEADISRLRGFP